MYNYVVQQIDYESGQNRKIAALSMIFVCTFYFRKEICMNDKIINKLKKLNNKATINGDIPVSCIILYNNKIIVSAYNKKYKNNNPFDHAEILAIKKASKKLKAPNLIDCTMYVTLKPCNMCEEVIKESKIRKVYYIVDNVKNNNYVVSYHQIKGESEYFIKELKDFFKDKR